MARQYIFHGIADGGGRLSSFHTEMRCAVPGEIHCPYTWCMTPEKAISFIEGCKDNGALTETFDMGEFIELIERLKTEEGSL